MLRRRRLFVESFQHQQPTMKASSDRLLTPTNNAAQLTTLRLKWKLSSDDARVKNWT